MEPIVDGFEIIEPGTQIHSEQVTADPEPYDFLKTSRWAEFSRPPKTALKTIAGGRLSGLTDINPQWRLKVMDATYGACGHGWRYEIAGLDRFVCDGGEIIQFAHINVYIRINGEWGFPIPATGGSKLAAKEKSGFHYSDEAQKMAITDALSVAFKMIGVGSEIYEGRWDGSKYKDEEAGTPTTMGEVHRQIRKLSEKDLPTDSEITHRLETCLSLSELQFEFFKLTKEQRKAHEGIKDSVKTKLTMQDGTIRPGLRPSDLGAVG